MDTTLDPSTHLIQIMQAAIAPVTLISGVGLLILSMTNRYGRVIDRTRELLKLLAHQREKAIEPGADGHHVRRQIRILYNRAQLMRSSIACGIGSIFFTSLTIFLIFSQLSFGNELSGLAQFSFVAALLLLIVGMGLYVLDIRLSLGALQLEIRAGDEDLI